MVKNPFKKWGVNVVSRSCSILKLIEQMKVHSSFKHACGSVEKRISTFHEDGKMLSLHEKK